MNFTVASHGRAKDATGFINYDDVVFDDIPEMVTSGFNYCACKLVDNYRLDENFDGSVDVLIIDIDEECTIEQAKILFEKYKFFLITTKSHQKEKNDLVCDRFRLFFHLDETIHIRQKAEKIYSDFIDRYPFIDTSCRNVSRLFFSSPKNAEVFFNDGARYPVYINSSLIDDYDDCSTEDEATVKQTPEVKNNEFKIVQWLGRERVVIIGDTNYMNDGLTEDDHLNGIQKFLDDEYYAGQRATTIFKAGIMMKKDGFDEDFIMDYLLKEFNERGGDSMKVAMKTIRNSFKYE